MPSRDRASAPRAILLLVGFVVTIAAALSVHVVMLQVFDVPYPGNLPANGWARLPDRLLSVAGAAILHALLPDRIRAWPAWQRIALLFLLLGTIHETLLRLPIMNIAVASRWTGWPFLDALPAYLVLLAVAVAVVAAARMAASPARATILATALGVPIYMILAPLVKTAFAGLAAWTSAREGVTLYNPPYDWHVELPAYVTFVEPTLAAFAVAALVWGKLPRDRWRAGVALALLLFALRGQFFSTFVNIRYAGTDAVTAMLSFGQFTLESLTLATLTAVTWVVATRGSRSRG